MTQLRIVIVLCLSMFGFTATAKSETPATPAKAESKPAAKTAPKSTVNVEDKYEVHGDMDKEAIRKVIRDNLGGIRTCYEIEIKKTPDLYGKIILEWDIDVGGKVSAARVIKSLNKNVDECVKGVIQAAKWPEPSKGQVARVRYPFVFSNQ